MFRAIVVFILLLNAAAAADPKVGDLVFYKPDSLAIVGGEVVAAEKFFQWPDRVVRVNGDLIWLSRGQMNKADVMSVDQAFDKFDQEVNDHPDRADAWRRRSCGWVFKGQFANAINDLDKAVLLDPNDATTFNNRSGMKLNIGDFAGAIKDCDEAIRIQPNFAHAYDNRASAKGKLNDLAGAMKDSDEAIRLNPNDASIFMQTARF